MLVNDNANDFNAGYTSDAGSGDDSGQGGQSYNGTSEQGGDPGNQGGQQPTQSWEAKEQTYKQQLSALNRQLVEARRQGNNSSTRQPAQGQQNGQGEGEYNAFTDPAGQYGIALQVATGNVRAGLENILDYYPELPAEVVKQVRKNPWAFASQDSYMGANADNALLDIEQYLADTAETAGDNGQQNQNGQGNGTQHQRPASMNPNSAPEGTDGEGQTDPMEDWSMPLDQLEKKANKVKMQMAQQTQK